MSQYALEARNLTKAYPGFTLGPLPSLYLQAVLWG